MVQPSYPKTVLDFAAKFHSDDVCLEYLIQSRWPDGFVCPHCRTVGGWWLPKYRRFECKQCHRHTSPLAGTLIHRSHLPIHIWFWAAYLVATHTPGISAVQLKRQLGISKIDSAWFLLHRLRRGMVRTDREPLEGVVEADETYIGGPAKDYKGRGVIHASNKSLVVGAVEIKTYLKKSKREEKAGRLRIQVIKSATAEQIKKFLNTNVKIGSSIKSDGWRSYSSDVMRGYQHVKQIQGKPERAKELSPHIHKIFGNLQAWLIGIHHGVEPKYLQSYLDEFVFRFNRRENPMVAFRSLLGIISQKTPPTKQKLVKP